ncbi:MAG: hypothetical protein FWC75_06820 [Oscillospiraceae bacterium]|nr:hypothetical protein [Oscillospiraceae bacterium]
MRKVLYILFALLMMLLVSACAQTVQESETNLGADSAVIDTLGRDFPV